MNRNHHKQTQTPTRKRAAKQWPQFRKVTFDGIHYEIVRVASQTERFDNE